MTKQRLLAGLTCFLLGLSVMAGALLTGAPVAGAQQHDANSWWAVKGLLPNDVNLRAVTMTDDRHAWVAGKTADNKGIIYLLRWNGERWFIEEEQSVAQPVLALAAVSDEKVWAVGEQNMILKGGLSGWSVENTDGPFTDHILTTIQMLGNGEEGWAAGYIGQNNLADWEKQPLLYHYKNGAWQRDTSITGAGPINSLHLVADGGWAVGTSIWHYQRGSWSTETMPAFCPDATCFGSLTSVRALSGTEAWAVGWRMFTCAICFPFAYAAHRTDKGWEPVLPEAGINTIAEPYVPTYLNGITGAVLPYNPDGGTLLAAGAIANRTNSAGDRKPLVARYFRGQWQNQFVADMQGSLNAISTSNGLNSVAVGDKGLVMVFGYAGYQPEPTPVPVYGPAIAPPVGRVGDPHDPNVRYFPEVGHTLRGGFFEYWAQHGGLEQFGYPLTEEYWYRAEADGPQYTVQWFERARFEYHPENAWPNNVLLGLLGREVTKSIATEPPFLGVGPPKPPDKTVYFPETAHTMAAQFVSYWLEHGGLAVYGYPISEPFMQTSKTDGKLYLVQYFERNRFEYHPELPEKYRVSLGLLGVDILRAQGWIR